MRMLPPPPFQAVALGALGAWLALAAPPAAVAQDAPGSFVVEAPPVDPDADVESDPEVPRPRTDPDGPTPPAAAQAAPRAVCGSGSSSGYAWDDPARGQVTLPEASEGAWWVEVRSHRGGAEVWWAQGPYAAETWAGTPVALDPPTEVLEAARGPVLLMARLVLRDDAGEPRSVPLPRLVAELGARTPRYLLEADLEVPTVVLGGESFPSTDLPDAL